MWISDTPSILDEYMQCVTKTDDLKILLRSKVHRDKMAKMDSTGKSLYMGYQPGFYVHISAEQSVN